MAAKLRIIDPAIPIRVLLVEDSDIDADLILIHLKRSSLAFDLERVDHRSAYQAALANGRYDIILADYSLPDFDGHAALQMAQGVCPEVPFLFVSGVVGEDLATAALREGATDYVLKRTLERLPGAVERAIGEARERDYRRRVEGALLRSEVSMKLAVEAAGLGMWAYHPETGELTLDPRTRTFFGLRIEEEVRVTTFLKAVFPTDRQRVLESLERAVNADGQGEYREEFRILSEGGERWLLLRGHSFYDHRVCTRLLGVVQDITEQKRAAAALERQNADLEAAVVERTRERDRTWQLSRDLMLVGWFDRPPLALNPAWTLTLGWSIEEIMTAAAEDLIHEDDRAMTRSELQRVLDGLPTRPFENRCRHKDGTLRWISWSAVASGEVIYAVGRDVTQERAAQEQLRQAQKMETIGQLTGGVAHDFNNLLTVITGNLETVQRHAQNLGPETGAVRIRNAAANAMRGAERAASLTQRLLAFARRQPLNPKPVDLNRLIEGMSDLLSRSLGEQVSVDPLLGEDLWYSHVDPNQLEIAILNLAVNARDAMNGSGRLTIETANIHLDEDYAAANTEVRPGSYVVIAVTDTGSGMTREVLSQVFEPFFTTKDVGHGTGLGLSQVYGFVKQSGGHVKIYTEVDKGTTVKLYLPRFEEGFEPEIGTAASQPAPKSAGGETILVVEDDDDVRHYSSELLRELGYGCLVAPNGHAALGILRSPVDVSLLFTDVGLPGGMNGRELADAARRLRPGLKTLFTSGYERSAIVHDGRLDPGIELISKPFTYRALAAKVRQVLDRSPTAPRILVVEDDAPVRVLAVEFLQDAGFATEEADTGADALSRLHRIHPSIDAVILDLGLPDRNGWDLAREIRDAASTMPILIATGHESTRADGLATDERVLAIQKPYARQAMLEALARLGLGAPAAPPP